MQKRLRELERIELIVDRLADGERQRLLEFLDAAFCPTLFRIRPGPRDTGTPPADCHLYWTPADTATIPPSDSTSGEWQPVHCSPILNVSRRGPEFVVCCGGSSVLIDSQGSGTGILDNAFWDQPLLARREFFLLVFLMLLHSRSVFGLHGTAVVSPAGQGVVLSGPSGSGKTSTALAALSLGWRHVSDDALLMEAAGGGGGGPVATVHAFRRGFSAGAELASRFPGVAVAYEGAPEVAGGKRLLQFEQAFPGQGVAAVSPAALVFPRIGHGEERCSIQPLPPAAALFQLVRQSPGFLAGLPGQETQLSTLRALTAQAPAAQLTLGADARRHPPAAIEVLSAWLRGGVR